MSIKLFNIVISVVLIIFSGFVPAVFAAEVVDFSLEDLQGNTHTVKQYRGKWVVVNYWGVYCAPCLREMPELSDFHDKHKDSNAVVLGINQEDIPGHLLQRFADKMEISFPLLKVPFEQVTSFGQVTLLPTTFIINPQGELIARQQGPISKHVLEDYIKRKQRQVELEKLKQSYDLKKN